MTDTVQTRDIERASSADRRAPMVHQWAIEKLLMPFESVRSKLGKALDCAATLPVIGIVVRLLSSIWLGVLYLVLIAVYVGIGSGFANIRSSLEMNDLEFFNAWPMVTLSILMCTTLLVVSLRRIPFNIFKVGVWNVHLGILLLVGSCFYYFINKVEGSTRVFLNQTVKTFYDASERALYAYRVDDNGDLIKTGHTMTPLPGMPYYHEHSVHQKNPLDHAVHPDAVGALGQNFKDVRVKVVGFYPYTVLQPQWVGSDAPAGDSAPNPAIRLSMTVAGESGGNWLIGKIPAQRILDAAEAPFGVEYLYRPDPQRLADLAMPFKGGVGVTVRSKKHKFEETLTLEEGKEVTLKGTPYTIKAAGQMALPLVSKGYEGAASNALNIDVVRDDGDTNFRFTRMAVHRFPELSPDFIEEGGKRKRVQARVDHDIEIIFHDAQRDQFYVVEHADGTFELIHRARGGSVTRQPMTIGKAVDVKVVTVPMRLAILERSANAKQVDVPFAIDPKQRPRSVTVGEALPYSVIELEVSKGEWRTNAYVPFTQFASIAEPPLGRLPVYVDVPGAGKVAFAHSTVRRPLPSEMTLISFEPIKFKSAQRTYANYRSTLQARHSETGKVDTLVTQLNEPATHHGLYFFQAAWDGNDNARPEQRFSVLGVANRPGVVPMTIGSIMIILGIAYAFYVKPILLKYKKQAIAAMVAANGART